MNREYLRVTPTTAPLDPGSITNTLGSLHKLTRSDSTGPMDGLTPFGSPVPVTFEFVAISEGWNKPVQFLYSTDGRLGVLEQRLRSIYPSSFDITRVEVDLLETWYDTELPSKASDGTENDEIPEVPSREDLAEIRGRSPLVEMFVDTERDATLMGLTETGERPSEPETGKVQAAGSDVHDDALWRGQTSGYDSHSEADMALCLHLAFWTGGDPSWMDLLFRRSGLMREK